MEKVEYERELRYRHVPIFYLCHLLCVFLHVSSPYVDQFPGEVLLSVSRL